MNYRFLILGICLLSGVNSVYAMDMDAAKKSKISLALDKARFIDVIENPDALETNFLLHGGERACFMGLGPSTTESSTRVQAAYKLARKYAILEKLAQLDLTTCTLASDIWYWATAHEDLIRGFTNDDQLSKAFEQREKFLVIAADNSFSMTLSPEVVGAIPYLKAKAAFLGSKSLTLQERYQASSLLMMKELLHFAYSIH